MKQRFSSLDVLAISHELHHTLAGTRLTNVYDLVPPSATPPSSASSSRALLLRFSRSQEKHQLVVDSGFRCHLTAYDARASAARGNSATSAAHAPSSFVARLRTFLNGRHVTSVAQVGTDRIVELRFSDGQFCLYLEFFAAGNIILTDPNAKVLALQRTVAAFRSASLNATLNVGSVYGLAAKQNVSGIPPITCEALRGVLQAAVADDTSTTLQSDTATTECASKKKNKPKSLSRILSLAFTDLPQVLIDHVLLTTGFVAPTDSEPPRALDVLAHSTRVEALFHTLQEARSVVQSLISTDSSCHGYIIAKKNPPPPPFTPHVTGTEDGGHAEAVESPSSTREDLDFMDFHPFSPHQFEIDPNYVILPLASFNKAADEFYSHLQGLKANRQLHMQESAASKKLEATRRDQAMRIESLQGVQQLNTRKAAAIVANSDWVQAAIDAVNDQLMAGTDWEDLAHLIENSAESNPVAALIKLPLRLAEGIITVQISDEPSDEIDEEESQGEGGGGENSRELLDVDVKLALSAWSNSREYYDQKRAAAVKEQKTKEVTSLALRSAEKKVAEELKRVKKGGKSAPMLIRQQMWFEKFLWFVSSDGNLILAAKESQQSEILYRRHLRRGDAYVHADISGSPGIVVVKNRTDAKLGESFSPATLAQAGCLAVCASEAWDNKTNLGAYWVYANQVFKTSTHGDVLPPGSFDIRGEKNYLQPPQRILGFGLFFKIANTRVPTLFVEEGAVENEVGVFNEGHANKPVNKTKQGFFEESLSESPGIPTADSTIRIFNEGNFTSEGKKDLEVEGKQMLTEETVPQEEPLEEETLETGRHSQDNTSIGTVASEGQSENILRVSSPLPLQFSTIITGATATRKRGLKGKAKRLAKYRDQDEEDRAQAERLIGIAAGREKAASKERAKIQREAELASYEEHRRAQQERRIKATQEFEKVREAKLLTTGDVDEDEAGAEGADGEGNLVITSSLVGRTAAGDEILEVIPVCAPWPALACFKYKVKLQPGRTKKGRAMRDVLERWQQVGEAGRKGNKAIMDEQSQDPDRIWPREVELIRGLKMEEASNCVPVGKVTLMMDGGLALGKAGLGNNKGGGKSARQASGKSSSRGAGNGKRK